MTTTTTYRIVIAGQVHTVGLALAEAVKIATGMDYDADHVSNCLLKKGSFTFNDDVSTGVIEVESK